MQIKKTNTHLTLKTSEIQLLNEEQVTSKSQHFFSVGTLDTFVNKHMNLNTLITILI